MRTTEPARWQQLLDKVANLPPALVSKFCNQERFSFLGCSVTLGTSQQKQRFCTVEGLNAQLDDFQLRRGIVYYLDESANGLQKTAFEKTHEDHYKTEPPAN